ncbi:hypothetical protein C5E45_20790 [Nocardia nova]|uniref:Uncharacterized protein n=1 Tax=Nocardia nova TaxID=37330 RepID=A0A2S6AMQ4_9NOCA|nr:hypothetical protein [Nocardia nova]PPJ36483.1 hypothetical protein C5E45_20790 [Nocardia nova]
MTWFDNLPAKKRLLLQSRLQDAMAAPVREYAKDDVGFGCWLLIAISAYYLKVPTAELVVPEAHWRNHYDNGLSPFEALEAVTAPAAAGRG